MGTYCRRHGSGLARQGSPLFPFSFFSFHVVHWYRLADAPVCHDGDGGGGEIDMRPCAGSRAAKGRLGEPICPPNLPMVTSVAMSNTSQYHPAHQNQCPPSHAFISHRRSGSPPPGRPGTQVVSQLPSPPREAHTVKTRGRTQGTARTARTTTSDPHQYKPHELDSMYTAKLPCHPVAGSHTRCATPRDPLRHCLFHPRSTTRSVPAP